MSLLLSQASPYTEIVSTSKKNPRMQSTYDNIQREASINEGFQDHITTQTEREKQVQNILNNTQKQQQQNMPDESGLASYNPLVPPFKIGNGDLHKMATIPKATSDSFQNPAYSSSSSSSSSKGGSNYTDSYTATPYYKGLSSGNVKPAFTPHNSQLLEKLNYMIRLLEEQQKEPTQNIMEEFVLYGLLGVFMIYLVDSFARAGKYIR